MHPTSSIFVVPDSLLVDCKKKSTIRFRHPRSAQWITFIWDSSLKQLIEIQRIGDEHRSWIVQSVINSIGYLYLCTPVDPLFLIIPNLTKQAYFVTAQYILEDFGTVELQSCIKKRLSLLCETKEIADHQVYRYSKSLTMTWLSSRVGALVQKLIQLGDHDLKQQIRQVALFTEDAVSAQAPGFTCTDRQDFDSQPSASCLHIAYAMVADYLPVTLAVELADFMNIPARSLEKKAVSPVNRDSENVDPVITSHLPSRPTDDYSTALNTHSSKSVEPANKKTKRMPGTQSITSFFQRRPM